MNIPRTHSPAYEALRTTSLCLTNPPPSPNHPMVDESRDNLLRVVNHLSEADRHEVLRACFFGDIAHIKDVRKSGEPYITHPIAVAEILAGFRLDKDTLCAAILHDTVEDTDASLEEVELCFGATVAKLVDGVTKLKSQAMTKKESQAATFHKILTATLADPRVLIIKLADRLHNMSTLDAVSEEKQKRTAQETLSFYVPFARVLGLNDIADYIELLCYRNLNPAMYTKFTDKLLQHGLGRQYQKTFIQAYLQKTLSELGLSGVVQVLDNRAAMYRQFFKNRGDINRLIHHYELEIVTEDIDACDKLAAHLVKTHGISREGIFDNIRKPLPGGNQSLTLIYHADYNHIKVTLLTRRMQKSARLGVIGNDNEISHSVIQASLRNMQDLASEGEDADSVSIIDELINYLHERKMVCYSPQGRAYELPRGATALDFAYAVGPAVGNIATGANINGQHGKLGQVLAEGDTVEIETDPKATVQANWLGFIATNKARKEILKFLRNLPEDTKIAHGKNALEWSLKTYGKSTNELTQTDWADILAWRGVDNQEALFLQIAEGTLLPQLVVSRLFSDVVDSSEETAITKTKHLLAGVKGVEVDFSSCCNPIYGDPIVGHLSRNGLTVHRHKCHSLINIRKENPYQIIQLSWKNTPEMLDNKDITSVRFSAFLRIFAELGEERISQVIYEMKALNIGIEATNIKHDAKEGRAAGTTTLQIVVRSRSHLQEGIDKLRHLLGYPNIMRLYHG
ncbi:MAG: HD domain-containing protein [Moraxella sp.]|nr:HD domain-containing protein [Moraxella sp.]